MNTALAERLRVLRRDAGLPASPVARTEVPEHIRRLLGLRARGLQAVPRLVPDRDLPGDEIAPGLGHAPSEAVEQVSIDPVAKRPQHTIEGRRLRLDLRPSLDPQRSDPS